VRSRPTDPAASDPRGRVSVPDDRLGVEGRPGVADSQGAPRPRRGRFHGTAVAATRAIRLTYPLQRAAYRVHDWAFRRSGGRIGRMFARRPCLVLTTTGRRSGRPRTVVLVYVADGDRWIVVASNMGSHDAPAWLANLRAAPRATVTIGGSTVPVRAREATDAEHDVLWERVDRANYGQYGRYQAISARRIPLVLLEPA
jgi:deazaflavin-dependent oxidoreductase (nitroreductase family)